MFFRREKVKQLSFDDYLEKVRKFGFAVQSQGSGTARISRGEIAGVIEDTPSKLPRLKHAGLAMRDDIGLLVNGGYQMFWATPTGKRRPAQAAQLRALHEFTEDLKEALGITSLYNEGLGTVSDLHLYDRVEDRDEGKSQIKADAVFTPDPAIKA